MDNWILSEHKHMLFFPCVSGQSQLDILCFMLFLTFFVWCLDSPEVAEDMM